MIRENESEITVAEQNIEEVETKDALASHVFDVFSRNQMAKSTLETRMITSSYQRKGVYAPSELAKIQATGMSELYLRITATKCQSAEAWLNDILSSEDKMWGIIPTPIPDLKAEDRAKAMDKTLEEIRNGAIQFSMQTGQVVSPQEFDAVINKHFEEVETKTRKEIYGEAMERAERMENKIYDQLTEGGFKKALSDAIADLTYLPVSFIRCPIFRRKKVLKWQDNKAIESEELVMECERVSPFDVYWDSGASSIEQSDVVQVHILTTRRLKELKNVGSFINKNIDEVIKKYGESGFYLDRSITSSYDNVTENNSGNKLGRIEALEYWGDVTGKTLNKFGLKIEGLKGGIKDFEVYSVNIWVVGDYTIKTVINPLPFQRHPYYSTCYEKIPGMIPGNSLPDFIGDILNACNSLGRSILNNSAFASGPMIEYDVERVQGLVSPTPWLTIPSTRDAMNGGPAVAFYQPNPMIEQAMRALEYFERQADSRSLPNYSHGDTRVGGAGNTASGLTMLLSASARGIKQVLKNIYDDLIIEIVKMLYAWNMLNSEDEMIKGDAKVVVRGIGTIIAKEMLQVRRAEYLNMTNNQADLTLLGMARREIHRKQLKDLDIDPDKYLPDEDELAEIYKSIMMSAGGGTTGKVPATVQMEGGVQEQGGTQMKMGDEVR